MKGLRSKNKGWTKSYERFDLTKKICLISTLLPTTARPSVLNGLDLSGVEPFFHTSYLWQYHCFPFLWAALLYKYVCIYAVDLLINVYQNRLQKYYIKCIYQSTYLVASIFYPVTYLHTLLPIIRYIKRSDSKLSLLIGLKSLRKLESFREELDDYLHKFLSSFWPKKIFKSWIQMCFTKYRFWQLARSGLFLNLTFWSECQKKTWSSYIHISKHYLELYSFT